MPDTTMTDAEKRERSIRLNTEVATFTEQIYQMGWNDGYKVANQCIKALKRELSEQKQSLSYMSRERLAKELSAERHAREQINGAYRQTSRALVDCLARAEQAEAKVAAVEKEILFQKNKQAFTPQSPLNPHWMLDRLLKALAAPASEPPKQEKDFYGACYKPDCCFGFHRKAEPKPEAAKCICETPVRSDYREPPPNPKCPKHSVQVQPSQDLRAKVLKLLGEGMLYPDNDPRIAETLDAIIALIEDRHAK